MKPSSTTSSLKTPTTAATPRQPHRLSRSPAGQRGRSRKASIQTLPSTLRKFRTSPFFWPAVIAFAIILLALLYSALRISSHTADYYPSTEPSSTTLVRPAKKGRIGRAGAPDAPSIPNLTPHESSGATEAVKKIRVGEGELEESIRKALEDTWHLSAKEKGSEDVSQGNSRVDAEKDAEPLLKGADGKKRSLSELYEELDGLGISVDELNEVMQNAIGGNL